MEGLGFAVRDPQPMDAGFEQTMLDADALSKFLVLAPGCDGRNEGIRVERCAGVLVPDSVRCLPALLLRVVVLWTAVPDRSADGPRSGERERATKRLPKVGSITVIASKTAATARPSSRA